MQALRGLGACAHGATLEPRRARMALRSASATSGSRRLWRCSRAASAAGRALRAWSSLQVVSAVRDADGSSSRGALALVEAEGATPQAPKLDPALEQFLAAAGGEQGSLLSLADAVAAGATLGEQLAALGGGLPTLLAPGALAVLGVPVRTLLQAACDERERLVDGEVLDLLLVSGILATPQDAGVDSSGTGDAAALAVAEAALRAALDEAWRRPALLSQLEGARLTAVCVVLQRIAVVSSSGSSSIAIPPALVDATWRRLAALAQRQLRAWCGAADGSSDGGGSEVLVITEEQLAACMLCLASYPGTPPVRPLARVLSPAAAALPRLGPDGVRRAAAAVCAWAPLVRGRPPQQAAEFAAALADRVRGGDLDGGALAAVCQACVCWLPDAAAQDALAAAVAPQLVACSDRTAAAVAAGWLAPAAEAALAPEQLSALLQAAAGQPGDDGAAAAVAFFEGAAAAAAAGAAAGGGVPAPLLEAAAQQLARAQGLDGAGPSPRALSAAAAAAASCARAAALPLWPAALGTPLMAAAARGALSPTAACNAAAALCLSQPPDWQEQLESLTAACLGPQQLSEAPTQQLVDLALASDRAGCGDLRDATFEALAVRAAAQRLQAPRLSELLLCAASEGRRAASRAAGQQQQKQQPAAWAGAARACLVSLQHGVRFLPPRDLLRVLRALSLLGLQPQGMLAAAGLQVAASAACMAPRELATAAEAFARLRYVPPRALAAVASEARALTKAGAMQTSDALRVLCALARLRHSTPAARRLLNLVANSLLQPHEPASGTDGEETADGSGADGGTARFFAGDSGDGDEEEGEEDEELTDDPLAFSQQPGGAQLASTVALAPLRSLCLTLWAAGALRAPPARLRALLALIAVHPQPPRPTEVAAVVWACARLRVPRPQEAIKWAVRSMGWMWEDAAAPALAMTTWGLWKLGYEPSEAFASALVPAVSREWESFDAVQLPQLLFALSKWHRPPPPERLRLAAARLAREPTSFDGPGVCSLVYSLARLGAQLDQGTLAAAEARLVSLIQEQAASESSSAAAAETGGRRRPRAAVSAAAAARWRPPPAGPVMRTSLPADAADLALFFGACGANGYTPADLLRRFCVGLRRQLEDEGAAALMDIPPLPPVALTAQSQTTPGTTAAAASAAAAAAAAAAGGSPPSPASPAAGPVVPVAAEARSRPARRARPRDAGLLAAVVQGLSAAKWRDEGLLRELETLAMRRPLVVAMTPQQLALYLHSCKELGYVPSAWINAGLGRLLLASLPGMGPLDVSHVLCALAAWKDAPGGIGAARMRQPPWAAIVKGALQALLQRPQAAPSTDAAGPGTTAAAAAAAASAAAAIAGGDEEGPAAAAASGSTAAASAAAAAPAPVPNLSEAPVLQLGPLELADLLPALNALGQYDERLVALVLSRLQQHEASLSLGRVSAVAQAAAALRHEPTALLAALRRRLGGPNAVASLDLASGSNGNSSSSSSSGEGNGNGASSSNKGVSTEAWPADADPSAFEGVTEPGSVASRVLWTFAQLGRNPGRGVISTTTAALDRWCGELAAGSGGRRDAAGGSAAAGQRQKGRGSGDAPAAAAEYDLAPSFDFLGGGDSVDNAADAAAAPGPEQGATGTQQQERPWLRRGGRPPGGLPLRELSTALYSLALIGELQHPGAVALASRLAAVPPATLLSHPQFPQQARMLAACLLTAQAERLVTNPLAQLDGEVKERLAAEWRRSILARGAARPHRMQAELAAALRGMGLRVRAGEVTRDGVCCIDVLARAPPSAFSSAARSPSAAASGPELPVGAGPRGPAGSSAAAAAAADDTSEWLAVEILGPHNAARNTQAPLGAARLKWKLLAARGYRVVLADGWEWLRLGGPAAAARQTYLANLRSQLLRGGAAGAPAAGAAPAEREAAGAGVGARSQPAARPWRRG